MRARRSSLSVPGSSEAMLAKAAALAADELVVDLEDSVAPAAKAQARELVARSPGSRAIVAARGGRAGERPRQPLVPRRRHRARRAGRAAIGSLVVPKVESAEDVLRRSTVCSTRSASPRAESASRRWWRPPAACSARRRDRGRLAAPGGPDPRLRRPRRLARPAPGPDRPSAGSTRRRRCWSRLAPAGLQAIDGPYLGIRDDEGLRSARRARARARLRRQVGGASRPARDHQRRPSPPRPRSSRARARSSTALDRAPRAAARWSSTAR